MNTPKDSGPSRRSLLKAAGVAAASSSVSAGAVGQLFGSPFRGRRRKLRVAHLTDIHVQPELHAGEGMEKCLKHAMEQKPDLVIYGGDNIMDALTSDSNRVALQWELFMKVHKANCHVPARFCFGNHDVFGWGARDTFKSHPKFGKRFTLDVLGYERPYHSFDMGGWHFVILDSIQPKEGNGYTGGLDQEQFEWLSDDLSNAPAKTPVLAVSHIPIAAACTFLSGNVVKDGAHSISVSSMHSDAYRLKQLFEKNGNVKACLSGHIHLADRVEYLGVTYVCDGAVSGGWWLGNNQEFAPAYALLDLFEDGTFSHRLVEYGWKAQP